MENRKTLIKAIKEEPNKWRDIPCSWIRRLSMVKMSVLPRLFYRFNTIPIKILASCFVDIFKLILKITWRIKRPRMDNSMLKEKNQVGELTLPNFKIYLKSTVINTAWYRQNNRQIQQWNRIESSYIDPHKYSQMIFDKGIKAI